jgi:hypothetical protein
MPLLREQSSLVFPEHLSSTCGLQAIVILTITILSLLPAHDELGMCRKSIVSPEQPVLCIPGNSCTKHIKVRLCPCIKQIHTHVYETSSRPLTHFAMTLSMYTLILTVYQALLKSAVSGIGHRIYTTKKIHTHDSKQRQMLADTVPNGPAYAAETPQPGHSFGGVL